MQKFLLLGTLLFSLQLHAQNLQGVWEGKLNLNNSGSRYMNVRLELVKQDSSFFGLLYTRGLEKNIVYGCDYFITGFSVNGIVDFKWQKVQRAVAMKENDCRTFDHLIFGMKEEDSIKNVLGNWVWQNGNVGVFSCSKVSEVISDMAADEISVYLDDLYTQYETLGILLPVKDRFMKKVFELQVDSSDIVVELSTIDSSNHDSISVYFNGNSIAELHDLVKKPLRLRLKDLPIGANDLLVVSESSDQPKLNILMKIIQQGVVNLITIHPGFTANSIVLFTKKE